MTATRTFRVAVLVLMAVGLLPLRGPAAASDLPQNLYLPGITISAHTTGKDKPGPADKHTFLHCDVLLWISEDGLVLITQVTRSTGHSRMDDACMRAPIGQKMLPAQGAAGPVGSWAIIPLTWDLFGDSSKVKEPDRPNFPIAPIAPNQVPRVSATDYPKAALQRGEQGTVFVHVGVSDSGVLTASTIANGSGSDDLDHAALDAVRSLRFGPAFSDHKPVSSETDVAIAWVIPSSSSGAAPAAPK